MNQPTTPNTVEDFLPLPEPKDRGMYEDIAGKVRAALYDPAEVRAAILADRAQRSPAAPVVAEGLTQAAFVYTGQQGRDIEAELEGYTHGTKFYTKRERSPYVLGVKPSTWDEQIAAHPVAGSPTDTLHGFKVVVDETMPSGAMEFHSPSEPMPASEAHDILRDMLAIQEACGLHTDEYAPGSVIEYIKELEDDQRTAAPVPASEAASSPTNDAIAKSKRILALVDDYADAMNVGGVDKARHARTDLRKALMDEFAAPAAPTDARPLDWRVGNLLTMSDSDYPSMGSMFAQIWEGEALIARVYGDSADEVRSRASRVAAQSVRDAAQPIAPEGDKP